MHSDRGSQWRRQDDFCEGISAACCARGALRQCRSNRRRLVAVAELAAFAAARVVLREIDRLASDRKDFAFETTLSGLTYLRRMKAWKQADYRIEIVYLRLDSVDLAWRRIAARVLQGGHDVARRDVIRRFKRGWANFESGYRPISESWAVYDNSGNSPVLLERKI